MVMPQLMKGSACHLSSFRLCSGQSYILKTLAVPAHSTGPVNIIIDVQVIPLRLALHFMICHSKSAIDPAPQDVFKATRSTFHSSYQKIIIIIIHF
jgi:hypothetical protein